MAADRPAQWWSRPEQQRRPGVENRAARRRTYRSERTPWCRPGCALSCPVGTCVHLLDDDPTRAPVEWRIAWTLHGMPCPLGRDQWRECFAAIVDTYGSRVLVQGLRLAESIPQTGRQPWRHGELGAIADRIEQRRAAA